MPRDPQIDSEPLTSAPLSPGHANRRSSEIERDTVFFTICARNYLAHATVLAGSIAATHPGARLHVFLLDGPEPPGFGADDLVVVPAESVMPVAEWHHRQCYYDVLELATSIKAACFSHLFRTGWRFAIYVDPDLLFLNRLDAVFSAFAVGHTVVLTPHILSPLPAEGAMPDDLVILRAGLYNLGFAGFAKAPGAAAILEWWDRHLHTLCLSDPSTGVFTDQKWVDLVPIFEPNTSVIRDPGYNVAYWNLHERTVSHSSEGWTVEDTAGVRHALVFYHFSGFSPAENLLSRHESRFGDTTPGDTGALLRLYAERLKQAGLSTFSVLPAAKPRFPNGAQWDPVCRALYRAAVAAGGGIDDPLCGDAFTRWATSTDGADHLPRYLRILLTLRGDVAQAYDHGRNVVGLTRWVQTSGVAELGIDPPLLTLLGLAPDPSATSVNYVGYLRSHLGIAEAARGSIAALQSVGVTVHAHDVSEYSVSPTGLYETQSRRSALGSPAADITILGVNADQTPAVVSVLGDRIRSRMLIGAWAWETPEFPDQWCDRFDQVDEVWVASRFCADAIQAKATVPVLVIPYAVNPPRVEPDRAWLSAKRPEIEADEFLFLFQFDVHSVHFRKNPDGAIKAFTQAFGPDEPVRLIVKTLNGDRDPALLRELATLASGHRVTIWDEALESLDRFCLLATADAFVSLHRAEGFGLSIAEAMIYGRPVVTTGWSGNADFTRASNAAVVAYDLKPLERRWGPYPVGTIWAEPRLDDAARQMRRLIDDPSWRDSIARAGALTIEAEFSYEQVGAAMKNRLQRLARSNLEPSAKRLPEPVEPDALFARTLAQILRDMQRRPLFYAARTLRAPALLLRFGLVGSLGRAAEASRYGATLRP